MIPSTETELRLIFNECSCTRAWTSIVHVINSGIQSLDEIAYSIVRLDEFSALLAETMSKRIDGICECLSVKRTVAYAEIIYYFRGCSIVASVLLCPLVLSLA